MRSIAHIKNLLSEIVLPKRLELVLLVGMVIVFAFLNSFMICGDCFFGYAITENIRHPAWFPVQDLVISSSHNFLFYKLLAHIPWFAGNFNVRDFIFSTPPTLLLVLAWYNVFWEITRQKKIVFLALFFLLFSDTKLFLHGYPIPFFLLTSIGSIHFLQIFAFYYFLRGRTTTSFILLALSSYLHPASAFVFLAIFGTVVGIRALQRKHLKECILPFAVALAILLPNMLLLGQGIAATPEQTALLFDINYKIKQFATLYVDEYFERSYVYTFSALFLVLVAYKKKLFNFEHQPTILAVILTGFVGSFLWLLNLYVFHNLSVFYTLFIARAFYIIKPLLLIYIVQSFVDLLSRRLLPLRVYALLVAASLVLFSSLVGGLILWGVIILYAIQAYLPMCQERAGFTVGKREKIMVAVVVCAVVGAVGIMRNNKLLKIYHLLMGKNTFNFSFDISKNYSISKTNPTFSELVDWAKQFHGKLFLVPLDGRNDFVYFRYLTKNGIYANIDDMGQLTYTPQAFVEGYRRMTQLGFRIIDRGVLDFSGYNRVPIESLRATGADFAIFDKRSPGFEKRSGNPVFETERYVVYQLTH